MSWGFEEGKVKSWERKENGEKVLIENPPALSVTQKYETFLFLDGFLCAVLSGPNVIMPSEWMRWVWDSTEGKQSPEFTSEKQAQRILDLLMRHANDIAVTLTQFPQYYEPLFLARDHKGRTVSIVDEWCCGYVKGIALDPSGWQPLFEAHPDWFEAIHLYGTESGWDRLKELVEAYQDAD